MRHEGNDGRRASPCAQADASIIALDSFVAKETERLLSGRKRDLKLTGRMLEFYRQKSWRQRSAVVRSWMVWVGGFNLAMAIIHAVLIPHVFWTGVLISGLIVPGFTAVVHMLWQKPRSATIEGLSIILWMAVLMSAFGVLGATAGGINMERYTTGALFVGTIGIIVLSIDLAWTAAVAVTVAGLAFAFHFVNPALTPAAAVAIGTFYSAGIFATFMARKTLTIVAHDSFLMSLRDERRRVELAEANVRLGELATTDALTGIANRRSSSEKIAALWNDPLVDKSRVAFLMVDIDHFKRLNDSRGHAAGDDCIRKVASTIAASLRLKMDTVARYGGEEFLVVLTKADRNAALEVADRIRSAVAGLDIPNPAFETSSAVTVSIGVALAETGIDPEVVAQRADEALYAAKRQGRNRVCVYAGPTPSQQPAVTAPSLFPEWGVAQKSLVQIR